MKRLLPLLLLLIPAFPWLRTRWSWEAGGKTVSLCVDGAELEALFPPEDLSPALARLSAAGVGSVGVLLDGEEPSPFVLSRWTARLPPSSTITLRPSFKKFSDGGGAPVSDGIVALAGPIRFLLPAGTALPPSGPASPLRSAMQESAWLFPWPEFSRAPALRDLAGSFLERTIRAHSLDEEELLRYSTAAASSRMRRAVRERGVRYLYVRLFPGLSAEENLSYVEGLSAGLRRDGFETGEALPRFPSAPRVPLPSPVRQALAFLAAVLGPWLAFRSCRGAPLPAMSRPPVLGALSCAAALIVAALMSSPDALSGLVPFKGVKAALVFPLFLAGWEIFRGKEAASLLRRPLNVGAAMLLALAAGAAAVYLLRSGNDSALAASGAEVRVRELLESLLGVRPRFKEFAVGWPLLWLAASAGKRDARWLWLGGMIAPISIVNTFCHAHIPLDVSLLRTFHGFWLGSLVGCSLILIRARIEGRRA